MKLMCWEIIESELETLKAKESEECECDGEADEKVFCGWELKMAYVVTMVIGY